MLDADDWWAPEKLEKQLSLDSSPKIGLIHCLADSSKLGVPLELTFAELWQQNWIVNSSVLIRRSAFEALGGFNQAPQLISVEDYNLWMRVASAGWRIVALPEVLTFYSRGTGISSNIDRFLKASLYNMQIVGSEFGLPKDQILGKRLQIYDEFGRAALYERRIPLARSLLRTACWPSRRWLVL